MGVHDETLFINKVSLGFPPVVTLDKQKLLDL